MKVSIILFVLCIFAISSNAQEKAIVDYVSDGDTYYVHFLSGEKERVRLAEVDCPEKKQEYGIEVKEKVSKLISKGDTVELYISSRDRYDRIIAAVKYNDQDLATYLVKNGLAWQYKQYSTSLELKRLEMEARAAKIGLWKNADAIAPWEFRRSQ